MVGDALGMSGTAVVFSTCPLPRTNWATHCSTLISDLTNLIVAKTNYSMDSANRENIGLWILTVAQECLTAIIWGHPDYLWSFLIFTHKLHCETRWIVLCTAWRTKSVSFFSGALATICHTLERCLILEFMWVPRRWHDSTQHDSLLCVCVCGSRWGISHVRFRFLLLLRYEVFLAAFTI